MSSNEDLDLLNYISNTGLINNKSDKSSKAQGTNGKRTLTEGTTEWSFSSKKEKNKK